MEISKGAAVGIALAAAVVIGGLGWFAFFRTPSGKAGPANSPSAMTGPSPGMPDRYKQMYQQKQSGMSVDDIKKSQPAAAGPGGRTADVYRQRYGGGNMPPH